MSKKTLLLMICPILFSKLAWAYPSFIAYGYKSCATCHYNSQGNGPLNDYGRALFSSEIASRSFYDSKITDEQLGDGSGFLGAKPLPRWLRPHVKVRLMELYDQPGSASAKASFIPMQFDVGTALSFDPQDKWLVVATAGYFPTPRALKNTTEAKPSSIISREHYLRYSGIKNWFFYLGLMDKAFGVRIVDHTAVSRQKTGLAMNDQAHGMTVQYNSKQWELTVNPFVGNLSQDSDLRQKGFSVLYEYDLGEKFRAGGSFLSSSNSYVKQTRMAALSKFGFGNKNSLLAEVGIVQDKPNVGDESKGAYAMVEGMSSVFRGYNLLSQVEYFNQTMSSKSPDQLRWSFGALMFPMPRYEVRTMIINSRTQADSGVSPDQWQLQAQLHISL